MYQPLKCPYSYFSEALEFYFRVFFPVSILKIDLNVTKISDVQDYVCTENQYEGKYTYIVLKLRVKQVTYESNIQWQYKKAKAERKLARDIRNIILEIYALCWKFRRGPRVQERALLGLRIYLWDFFFNLSVCLIYFCLIFI